MKNFLNILLCAFFAVVSILTVTTTAQSQDVYVHGYTRTDGTYVAPHYRTSPNNSINDNFSARGNFNKYTGKRGTVPRSPYGYSSPSYNYQNQYNPYR